MNLIEHIKSLCAFIWSGSGSETCRISVLKSLSLSHSASLCPTRFSSSAASSINNHRVIHYVFSTFLMCARSTLLPTK